MPVGRFVRAFQRVDGEAEALDGALLVGVSSGGLKRFSSRVMRFKTSCRMLSLTTANGRPRAPQLGAPRGTDSWNPRGLPTAPAFWCLRRKELHSCSASEAPLEASLRTETSKTRACSRAYPTSLASHL